MRKPLLIGSIAAALLVTGCVTIPTAPTVTVLPGSNKNFDQFVRDEDACRAYAQSTVSGAGQAASNNAAGAAVAGSALGAAAGAIIGSATGNAGSGAAIGAGTGLLFGSAAGANGAGYSSYQLQRQFDSAYMQCMYARGNQIPGRVVRRGSTQGYPPPDYPPPDYRGYNGPGGPSNGYPPPSQPGSYPPPNTPPPS